jgi:ubiquinone/menaquinone biosynthesis C-methylase UbiE
MDTTSVAPSTQLTDESPSANPFDRKYRRWYSSGAGHYDERFESTFGRLEGEYLVELLHPTPEMTILDVGTGTGRAALALARAGAQVTGVDLTPAMLSHAAAKRDTEGLTYPTLICANARDLPFPDASFDAVVSIRMLHLFPTDQLQEFVDEMVRVLKPGGTLLIEFNSPFAGGAWIIARETLRRIRRQKNRYYLFPWHMDRLFHAVDQREVYGFWLPGLGPLTRRVPRLTPLLRAAKLRPPLGWVGDKVLVRGAKRG